MRIGVHVINFDFAGGSTAIRPVMLDVARAAEEAGLDNLSVMDHWFQMIPSGGPELNMLEGYTTLGFLAAATETVDLQLLVTGVTYRQPGLLAKIVSTLDVLSGGRATLGIGAAWYEEEHRGLGVPFPPVSERFERLEETLQIVRQMWDGPDAAYDGRHYHLERTLNLPAPVRTPPIMIGGSGERKTLRLVARYADACNLFASPGDGPDAGPAAIARKLGVLREHCEREGTDYDRIRKTILWSALVNPEDPALVGQLEAFAEIGVTEVHLMHFGNEPAGFIRSLAEHLVEPIHALG